MTALAPERAALRDVKRVVVKIGSRLLAESPAGRPATIADQVAALIDRGVEVILVSSGAIALGVKALRLPARPADLPGLQAAAAVGQSRLMQHWEHAFAPHDRLIGQVLLTHDDVGTAAGSCRPATPCARCSIAGSCPSSTRTTRSRSRRSSSATTISCRRWW